MLLLGFHIVAVGALIFIVGLVAYRMGQRDGERRALNRIELEREER